MNLKWTNAREIAEALARRYPEADPLAIRLTDLGRMVRETPGFADEPTGANSKVLQAIQTAWLDEVSD
ncbi:MAG: Fe-S cluster assembly protein IscX [Deltaproteobacteria bacterium]|nr:Fe-S cluster assembly protein IscX [Deltaproteobacteria bacterium]